jgi:hypothetical protein
MRIKKKTVCPTIQKKEKIYEIRNNLRQKNTALKKPTMGQRVTMETLEVYLRIL